MPWKTVFETIAIICTIYLVASRKIRIFVSIDYRSYSCHYYINVDWGNKNISKFKIGYIKFDFAFASAGNDDLLKVTSLNMRLDTKQITDSGNGTAGTAFGSGQADENGTVVNFNLDFVDIESITVTPKGTSTTGALIAIYDFTDIPNPTSFKVLLYNLSLIHI